MQEPPPSQEAIAQGGGLRGPEGSEVVVPQVPPAQHLSPRPLGSLLYFQAHPSSSSVQLGKLL